MIKEGDEMVAVFIGRAMEIARTRFEQMENLENVFLFKHGLGHYSRLLRETVPMTERGIKNIMAKRIRQRLNERIFISLVPYVIHSLAAPGIR